MALLHDTSCNATAVTFFSILIDEISQVAFPQTGQKTVCRLAFERVKPQIEETFSIEAEPAAEAALESRCRKVASTDLES